MTIEERVRELHDRAVKELVEAHAQRRDEPLVLAIRFNLDQPSDVYLLEALRGFPGGDDDELMVTTFDPSPQLRILGTLQLVLGSPAQIRSAADRHDAIIDQARLGKVEFSEPSDDARDLRALLGL
jgi:hypothetical protein